MPTLPLGSAIYLRVLSSEIVSLFSKNTKKENFNVPGLSIALLRDDVKNFSVFAFSDSSDVG